MDSTPVGRESVGTLLEMGAAFAQSKPVVLVDNRVNSVKSHPLVQRRVIIASSLDEAYDILYGLFGVWEKLL